MAIRDKSKMDRIWNGYWNSKIFQKFRIDRRLYSTRIRREFNKKKGVAVIDVDAALSIHRGQITRLAREN